MSNKQIKAGIVLSLRDLYSAGLREAGQNTTKFTKGLESGFGGVKSKMASINGKLAMVGAGFGAAQILKNTIDFDARLVRLGTNADMSSSQVEKLKKQIYDVATAADIKIDPSDLTAALEVIIERTGDIGFATSSIRTLGETIQATGATGEDVGGLASEFQKVGMSATDMASTIDVLIKQGKQGAFAFSDFSAQGARLISTYAAAKGGMDAGLAKEMGATMQILRMGAGSSDQATTTFEALVRNLSDPKKQAELKKAFKIDVRDQTTGQFRDLSAIIGDIAAKGSTDFKKLGISVVDAQGKLKSMDQVAAEMAKKGAKFANLDAFGAIFDAEGMRGLQAFQVYGDKFDDLATVVGDGTTRMADSQRNAATTKAGIDNLVTSVSHLASASLDGPLKALTTSLNWLADNPAALRTTFEVVKAGLLGIAAIKVGSSVVGLINGVRNLRSPSVQAGATALAGGGVQAVEVVNWPVGFGGAGSYATKGGKLKARRDARGTPIEELVDPVVTPKSTGRGRMMLRAGGIAGGLMAFTQLPGIIGSFSDVMSDTSMSLKAKNSQIGGLVGSTVASIGGGVLASAALSLIPGIGPIIGPILGPIIGGFLGNVGEAIGRLFSQPSAIGQARQDTLPQRLSDRAAEVERVKKIQSDAARGIGPSGVVSYGSRQEEAAARTAARLAAEKKAREQIVVPQAALTNEQIAGNRQAELAKRIAARTAAQAKSDVKAPGPNVPSGLEGKAEIALALKIMDERVEVVGNVVRNSIPADVNLGSAKQARNNR